MTDSVIADLGNIKDMRVISRTSVMPYKNSKKSMREIANELHADAVIEGSVMRSADRVRITVQLIDAARDQHLWSESYERELKNVFALQGEVAPGVLLDGARGIQLDPKEPPGRVSVVRKLDCPLAAANGCATSPSPGMGVPPRSV